LTITPVVPEARIEPCVSSQSMVIDFVIVTAPNPPGSRQLISPFTAVFEIAPANVLHGAVRLHGLASSPTPDTQVRLAWACAGTVPSIGTQATPRVASNIEIRMVSPPLSTPGASCGAHDPEAAARGDSRLMQDVLPRRFARQTLCPGNVAAVSLGKKTTYSYRLWSRAAVLRMLVFLLIDFTLTPSGRLASIIAIPCGGPSQ